MRTNTGLRYQYKTFPLESQLVTEDRLNALGRDGWLLVATLPHLVFVRALPMPVPEDLPLLLTIRQFSAQVNLSRSKIYELIRSGQIRCFKDGRSVRIPRQELTNYVSERFTV
jgi:excisionase family DNA binding protein